VTKRVQPPELDRLLIPAKKEQGGLVRAPTSAAGDKIQIRDLGHDFVVDFGAHFHTTTTTTTTTKMLDKQTAKEQSCTLTVFRFMTWATISSLTLAPRCAQRQQQCSKTNNKKF